MSAAASNPTPLLRPEQATGVLSREGQACGQRVRSFGVRPDLGELTELVATAVPRSREHVCERRGACPGTHEDEEAEMSDF